MQVLPQLGFMEAVKLAFSKLFVFKGRSRRSEYWWFYLVWSILYVLVGSVVTILSAVLESPIIYSLFVTAMLAIAIPITVRRMHDVGKSGWFMLIPIYSFILAVSDSQPHANEYGESPKYIND